MQLNSNGNFQLQGINPVVCMLWKQRFSG